MNNLKSSKDILFSINEHNFEEHALQLFRFQARHNQVYLKYLSHLNVNVESIDSIFKIPFMPIEFFKHHRIMTGEWEPVAVFESSGTTGQQRSNHFIEDLNFYNAITERIFLQFYGNVQDFQILALLPSYIERGNSSLVVMVKNFIEKSSFSSSGFFLNNLEDIKEALEKATANNRKTILIGVSFALLDLAEQFDVDLKDIIVMETGGMKGRREELTREALHQKLKASFKVDHIHSEYGMTELLSQAYAVRDGQFKCPPWMKIIIRDTNDPFDMTNQTRSGGVNVIDLANVQSCAFIETQDLGRLSQNNYFEVLGRFDNSDIRGCNLLSLG